MGFPDERHKSREPQAQASLLTLETALEPKMPVMNTLDAVRLLLASGFLAGNLARLSFDFVQLFAA